MKPLTILIIDDIPEQAEVLRNIIAQGNHMIEICTKGTEGLQRVKDKKFDVVFTDLSMPEVDGMQIIKYLKEHAPETKIVPVTAFGDWDVYAQTLGLGVEEFVSKPYNIPEVKSLIDKIASSKESR
jgi:YesN/AraC family two-component response regulator